MEATMALSERMRQEQAERARSVTPEVADALRKLTEHSKALMEALADLARQGAYEFKKAPGREFVDRSEAMRNVLRIRDAHTLMHHSARAALVAAGRNAGVDVPRVRDADEPLPPEVLVDAQTDRAHPPEQLKPCTRGVGGTPNDLRQVREDSQGLGEPGRLSPTSGVAADPAPQERELVGWQFRYVFEDQGNRRAAWGCVLQGAPSFTSGYRSYNGWQRRYFHEVRRVYADPVEPYVEDPHHKPDTSGVKATRTLPHPGSPEASAMLDSLLAEYNYPANTKNAARAGWEAAERWLRTAGVEASRKPQEWTDPEKEPRFQPGEET
jgi:hypothetical protein